MDWQEIHSTQFQMSDSQHTITKCERFTLYDHNFSDPIIDPEQQTFQFIFNCMKINKNCSSICKVNGNLKYGQININCSFINNSMILNGKWNYEKLQLMKFAFKYNQKSNKNMIMQVDPINGEMCLTANLMVNPILLKDHNYLREIITVYSKNIGQQSQKIFNTVQQIIFYKPSNEPYLKSLRVGSSSSFTPNIKMEKLLDKIKQLIATSSYYQIRDHINQGHLYRSLFKKKFKPAEHDKLITKEPHISLALVYEHKFHRKYLENQIKTKKPVLKLIKKYEEIQEKYEIQYTKYLKFGDLLKEQSVVILKNMPNDGTLVGQKILQQYIKREMELFNRLYNQAFNRHPNIAKLYIFQSIRYHHSNLISLKIYLEKNKKFMSLTSKLQLMCQICHVMCFLHSQNIGFAIQMEDILIGPDRMIEIVNLYRYKFLMPNNTENLQRQDKQFPYFGVWKKPSINKDPNQIKVSIEKCDLYNLALVLYIILMEKLPFYQKNPRMNKESPEEWESIWIVETQYYSMQGGRVVRLLGWLLLKCMNLTQYDSRAYIQWLKVILYETNNLLNSLL